MKTIFLLLSLALSLFADLRRQALDAGLRPLPTAERATPLARLGEKLFFDKRLSGDGTVSCASCHDLSNGGDDGLPTALGVRKQPNPSYLNAPTVLNAFLAKRYFWDGRAATLEEQAQGPLLASFEMAATPAIVERLLADDPAYRQGFKSLGVERPILEDAARAIAAFEGTLATPAPFDRFLDGDEKALSPKAKEGLALFLEKGCAACHSGPALGGEHMRKFPLRYHRAWASEGSKEAIKLLKKGLELSTAELPREEERYLYAVMTLGQEESRRLWRGFFTHPDRPATFRCQSCHANKAALREAPFPIPGNGGFLGEKKRKYFRVPILRNVTRTAPYFHNGTVKTLEEAIVLMGRHQSRAELGKEDVARLAAFLKSLEGSLPTP